MIFLWCGQGAFSQPTTWETQRDSCWEALDKAFIASEDLEDIWPMLYSLENVFAAADDREGYFAGVIPFVRQCYEYGFYAGARAYYGHLDSLAQSMGKDYTTTRASIAYELGRSYLFSGEAEQAEKYASKSRLLYREVKTAAPSTSNLLAAAFEDQNRLDSAVYYYQQAIEEGELLGAAFSEVSTAGYCENLALVYLKKANPQEALGLVKKALALKQTTLPDDDLAIAENYLNQGKCYEVLGQYQSAIELYEQAVGIIIVQGYETTKFIADVYLNLGVTYKKNGAYDQAINHYQLAEQIYLQQRTVPRSNLALIYSNQGNVYLRKEAFDLAESYYQRSLRIYQELEEDVKLADTYNNLSVAAVRQSSWENALTYQQKALALRKEYSQNSADLSNDYINLADIYLAQGKTAQAQLYADSAWQIEQNLFGERHPQLAYTYITKAKIAQAQGNSAEALELVQQALIANHTTFRSINLTAMPDLAGYLSYEYLLESLLLKAAILREQEPDNLPTLLLAQQHYRYALDLLDLVRRELSSREDQITLAKNVYRTVALAIEGGYELYTISGEEEWAQEVFYYMEKSKSNVLQSAMAANEARFFAGVPDTLLQLEDLLEADISFYKRELVSDPDSTEQRELQAKLFAVQEQYNQLLTQYQKQYPDYYELRHEQQVPKLKAIQFALREEQALIEYFTEDESLYRIQIDKEEITVNKIVLPTRFLADLRGLNKGIIRRMDGIFINRARRLYDLLLPADLPTGIKELILVPDGALTQIPFEVLLTHEISKTENIDFSQLPYLIRDYAVQYSPSGSLFYRANTTVIQQEGMDATSGLLALAPVFPGVKAIQQATRSNPFAGQTITPLPETSREITQLAKLFLLNGKVADTYIYQLANESQIKNTGLNRYRYLHIATHGFVNETHPNLSGLLLYPDSTSGEDGLLSVGEVYDLDLRADLVTLSACETGIGTLASGEGVLGFSRAFLYAGAERLLVSLWQVQDQATADLMLIFYEQILNAKEPDYSKELQKAKLKMIETAEFNHPYFWSPFILIRA